MKVLKVKCKDGVHEDVAKKYNKTWKTADVRFDSTGVSIDLGMNVSRPAGNMSVKDAKDWIAITKQMLSDAEAAVKYAAENEKKAAAEFEEIWNKK